MRIISGMYKGRRLQAPKKLPVRPTTDMSKEALFNIINNTYTFSQLTVLDLFAGTGNISYEFGSRGTKQITAVDAHYGCVGYIKKTAEELELPIQTIKSDVYAYLEKVKQQADLIFADPPYDFATEQFIKIAELVFQNELLLDDGVLIIEHSKHTDLSASPHFSHARKYGGSVFSFFEK
ncbi:RsmD family RNA methyltransferase [Aquimarina intermedia]|uniref:16S rRNA (Guanine(966)-N(2))-methyltransferase RsmD n=1 Tax=Aquimarina intermedia TaxID=350814 RepID=A0A5S5BZP3_9FLAO|nr:RsmD family RNA methyltransferase [Aquimarina intermedia]TYP71540.1 16S rRNA (guanine(966)-N(2))-methyltransferase RsmD [Aquimarina intermedia]